MFLTALIGQTATANAGDVAAPDLKGQGATDFYVATTGSESGDGSSGAPWGSIAFAIDQLASTSSAASPVTVHLAPGIYEEAVRLLPGMTLEGTRAGEVNEATLRPSRTQLLANDLYIVIAAQASGLRNLNLELRLSGLFSSCLLINDVVATVDSVVFNGLNATPTVGLSILNLGSSDSTIVNSEFTGLTYGVRAIETNASVTRSVFRNIALDALTLYRPESKGVGASAAPMLGNAGDLEGTGQNVFDAATIRKSFINNLNENTVLMAEANVWGDDDFEEIAKRMEGAVDFVPYRLSSNSTLLTVTLSVRVRDDETGLPIDGAIVSLRSFNFPPVSENTNGVYVFPAIPPQTYTIIASAPGYIDEGVLLRSPNTISSATISMGRTDSLTEDELRLVAEELLASNSGPGGSSSQVWDFRAALDIISTISLSQFEAMDLDADETLSVGELERFSPPCSGCFCPSSKSYLNIRPLLGDLFLLTLALFVACTRDVLRRGKGN